MGGQLQNPIHFILTGGTIDSFYDGTKDTVVPEHHSSIPRFIKSLHLSEPITFTEVCMKDSRGLTEADRKKILQSVEKNAAQKFIITHGTYTMPDTARYLDVNLKRKDAVVVLTGSMIPLNGFSPSDAPFNLGFVIAEVKNLSAGVYVAMNGRIFEANEVIKNIKAGKFISIFGEQ